MRELFAGEYACKLDDKGRFSVPAALRDAFSLSETGGKRRAVLVKLPHEQCLWLVPVPHWHALLELQRQRLNDGESRLFMHHMVYDWTEVEMDRGNRFLVARHLRDHVRACSDAVLVGMYDHLEVWEREAWLSHLAALEEEHKMKLEEVLRMPSLTPAFFAA